MSEENGKRLRSAVIDGGYCIGCGACAALSGKQTEMRMNKDGVIQPVITDNTVFRADPLRVCPFSEGALNEDVLGKELFGADCSHDNKVGYYMKTYAGHVEEDAYRVAGSSGGLGTWLIAQLFEKGLIDGVLHVQGVEPSSADRRLFKYVLSTSAEFAKRGAKSRYYPVEFSEVMRIVRDRPGRYALVGVPCFIKAARLLGKAEPVFAERIKFYIGLVCGHLKSAYFADMLAWQSGIPPGKLSRIDFRSKLPDKPADQYAVSVEGQSDGRKVTKTRPISELYGYDWGKGFLKYEACDYCDDVYAETADVTIGDAWLPQFVGESLGTNILVVRRKIFKDIVEEGMSSGKLRLEELGMADVIKSQESGLRHRREGLAYRLHLKDLAGEWRPPKRVKADADHLSDRQKEIFRLRLKLRKDSFEHFKIAASKGDFQYFKTAMAASSRPYDALYRSSLWRRALSFLARIFGLSGRPKR